MWVQLGCSAQLRGQDGVVQHYRLNPVPMRPFKLAASLRGYRREWLSADLVAAATLLVIALPEQLATARLAGMPPITGFYAFVAGTLAFALLGTNPQLSVGADSTIAPLFATAVGGLALTGSGHYHDLVGILALMSGAVVTLVWLFRLGWIAELLSAPIITGFLGGVSVVIVVHQLPDLLGIAGGGHTTIGRLQHVFANLSSTCGWTLAIGLGVFAIVILVERLNKRLPGALAGLLLSTVLVAAAHLQSHGVAVLGYVSHVTPDFGVRGLSWKVLGELAPVAGTMALVIVSQSAASTRAFARQGGYGVDVGQDLLAVGVGSIVAGVSGAFPVNASPPRTAAVAQAGGRTQLTGLIAAAALIALIPAADLLKDVPLATLAGVLLYVASRIFHVGELISIARFDRFELGLALVTLLTVALLGVEQGIGVAIALAILDRTRLGARPQIHLLGRIPGSTSWAPLGASGAVATPGVLVVLFATPLWYANATHFRAQIFKALADTSTPASSHPHAMVLDALGMSDVDYTGAAALRDLLERLKRDGIEFAIARAGQHVLGELMRAGLTPALIPTDRYFPDVDAAVAALALEPASEPSPAAGPPRPA
jgi:SulP family sulfate permease